MGSTCAVQLFRMAKERNGEKFRVKGFYVLTATRGTHTGTALAARPAVCVAEAPTTLDAQKLHRRIWNLGNVPFLLVRLPSEIRVYSGFVLGMQERERLGFVLGAQAVLFAGGRVLAVKNARSFEQDESRFHN